MLECLFNKVIEVSYRNQSIDLLCKSMDRFLSIWWAWSFIKKRLQHRCFTVSIAKFLRTPFYTEHLWWLLQHVTTAALSLTKKKFHQRFSLSTFHWFFTKHGLKRSILDVAAVLEPPLTSAQRNGRIETYELFYTGLIFKTPLGSLLRGKRVTLRPK